MHVLLAPDKFKGSLRAGEVAAAVAAGLRDAVPGVETVTVRSPTAATAPWTPRSPPGTGSSGCG